MKTFFAKFLDSLTEHILAWLLTSVGTILIALSFFLHDYFLTLVIEKKAESQIVWLTFGLIILTLLLLIALLYLLNKNKLKPAFGILWDQSKDYNPYCPVCKVLLSHNFESKYHVSSFFCPKCNTEFVPYHSGGIRLGYDEIKETFRKKFEK